MALVSTQTGRQKVDEVHQRKQVGDEVDEQDHADGDEQRANDGHQEHLEGVFECPQEQPEISQDFAAPVQSLVFGFFFEFFEML